MYSQIYDDTNVTGTFQPSKDPLEDGDISFCAALPTLARGQVAIHVNSSTDQPYTLKRGSHIATFSVLTSEQIKYVKPIDPGDHMAHFTRQSGKCCRLWQQSDQTCKI